MSPCTWTGAATISLYFVMLCIHCTLRMLNVSPCPSSSTSYSPHKQQNITEHQVVLSITTTATGTGVVTCPLDWKWKPQLVIRIHFFRESGASAVLRYWVWGHWLLFFLWNWVLASWVAVFQWDSNGLWETEAYSLCWQARFLSRTCTPWPLEGWPKSGAATLWADNALSLSFTGTPCGFDCSP